MPIASAETELPDKAMHVALVSIASIAFAIVFIAFAGLESASAGEEEITLENPVTLPSSESCPTYIAPWFWQAFCI